MFSCAAGREGHCILTNTTGVCRERSQCLGHTGFAPAHPVCVFPVYTAQAPGCSAGELSKAGPGLSALPRSKPLRFRFSGSPQRQRLGWVCVLCPSQVYAAQIPVPGYSTMVQTQLGLHFVPFPGPSSSGDQVLGEHTFPGVQCVLSPPPSQRLGFLGALSQVCHVSLLGS